MRNQRYKIEYLGTSSYGYLMKAWKKLGRDGMVKAQHKLGMCMYKEDIWSRDWLLRQYQEEVVEKLMNQSWAIDELNAGATTEEIEDCIWKDYEPWAEGILREIREEIASCYE